MSSTTPDQHHEKLTEHIEILHGYARQTLIDGASLSATEMSDKADRFGELVELGQSFKLTLKEMVALILKDIYHRPTGCRCHSCSARRART